jgi:hypothetical protein
MNYYFANNNSVERTGKVGFFPVFFSTGCVVRTESGSSARKNGQLGSTEERASKTAFLGCTGRLEKSEERASKTAFLGCTGRLEKSEERAVWKTRLSGNKIWGSKIPKSEERASKTAFLGCTGRLEKSEEWAYKSLKIFFEKFLASVSNYCVIQCGQQLGCADSMKKSEVRAGWKSRKNGQYGGIGRMGISPSCCFC